MNEARIALTIFKIYLKIIVYPSLLTLKIEAFNYRVNKLFVVQVVFVQLSTIEPILCIPAYYMVLYLLCVTLRRNLAMNRIVADIV